MEGGDGVEVRVMHGHDGDNTFGPDWWWAYWNDNAEDDEAYAELYAENVSYQQLNECLHECLSGNCWANRVRFFFGK